jgi:hypothetical protein
VNALLAGVHYSGLTLLATSMLSKVLQPIVYSLAASGQLAKPVLVLTITDGEPTDNPSDKVVQVCMRGLSTPVLQQKQCSCVERYACSYSQAQLPNSVRSGSCRTCCMPAGDQGGTQQAGSPVWAQGSGL